MHSPADIIRTISAAALAAGPVHAGLTWQQRVTDDLAEPLTQMAAHWVNLEVRKTGVLPDDAVIGAIQIAVGVHLRVIADYSHLIDGVAYTGGADGIARVLTDERALRVAEIEERHLRSAVVVILASTGGA